MIKVIPTVFAKDKSEFRNRFDKLISISRDIQIDFMDGKFVKAKSVALKDIPNLRKYKNNFEAHLMVQKPLGLIKKLKQLGFKKLIFHCNTDDNVKVIAETRKNGMKCFMALNPAIKINEVCYLFDLVDGILLMGVHPGKEHQSLLNSTYDKIKQIRKCNEKLIIQVDGGVNLKTARKLIRAGSNILNSGSFVAESDNPRKALKELKGNL